MYWYQFTLCSSSPSARIDLQPSSSVWYESLKDKIRHQQSKPVWVSEVTVRPSAPSDPHTNQNLRVGTCVNCIKGYVHMSSDVVN